MYEVNITIYEVNITIYEVNITMYEVNITIYEVDPVSHVTLGPHAAHFKPQRVKAEL